MNAPKPSLPMSSPARPASDSARRRGSVARRTIASARSFFESTILPAVSDYRANEARQELAQAEQQAREVARDHLLQAEDRILAARNEALRTLTEVRDEYEQLAVRPPSAGDFSRQLQDLAEQRLAKASDDVDRLEEVESAPLEWFDSLGERLPAALLEFSW